MGMTKNDVESIIGYPTAEFCCMGSRPDTVFPLNYSSRLVGQAGMPYDEVPEPWWDSMKARPGQGFVMHWWGNGYIVSVAFDDTGLVVGSYIHTAAMKCQRLGILERLRIWLGW
jgi:hypothetical protein